MNASNEVISNYIESRITRLEVTQENIFNSLSRIEKSINERFDRLEKKTGDDIKQLRDEDIKQLRNEMKQGFSENDSRITRLEDRIFQLLFIFPGVILGLIITHSLHWT